MNELDEGAGQLTSGVDLSPHPSTLGIINGE
jgi:hypothetical protein